LQRREVGSQVGAEQCHAIRGVEVSVKKNKMMEVSKIDKNFPVACEICMNSLRGLNCPKKKSPIDENIAVAQET
jgi:hypothetical protein